MFSPTQLMLLRSALVDVAAIKGQNFRPASSRVYRPEVIERGLEFLRHGRLIVFAGLCCDMKRSSELWSG